jgi:serine phosphatase RsbU (regulator of sigma subunit)
MFGEERLEQAIRENRAKPSTGLVQTVVDAVTAFSAGSRTDDVTVVALRGV